MNHTSNLTNGRAVIPSALRTQLDLKDGDILIWSVQGQDLLVTTRRAQLRNAQTQFKANLQNPLVSLADELIADRRDESRHTNR